MSSSASPTSSDSNPLSPNSASLTPQQKLAYAKALFLRRQMLEQSHHLQQQHQQQQQHWTRANETEEGMQRSTSSTSSTNSTNSTSSHHSGSFGPFSSTRNLSSTGAGSAHFTSTASSSPSTSTRNTPMSVNSALGHMPVERDGEMVKEQSLGAAPAISSTGIEDGIDIYDDSEGKDTAIMSSRSTMAYMADATSRSLAQKFNDQLRTLDRLQHGEAVDSDDNMAQGQVKVDNSKLKLNQDSFVDTKQTHLEKLRNRGGFRMTPEMTMFESSISRHFLYNAAAQLLIMPNAHRFNPHGPMEGFGLFLIEESDYNVRKPVPANFIFTPNKYGYGSFVARIPPPKENAETTALYNDVLMFGTVKEERDRALDKLHEYCKGADIQYPSSSCGIYMSMEAGHPVLWVAVLEGDKQVNESFQSLVSEGVREGYDWRSTFFVLEAEGMSKVQVLNRRAADRRRRLADGALKALGIVKGLEICSRLVDSPFYSMAYSQATRFYRYMAGCVNVEESEYYVLARSPLEGFTIFSGDPQNENRIGVDRYVRGTDECQYSMPAFTGKARLLSEVDPGKERHDPNPFIINLACKPDFLRKLGSIYQPLDFRFLFVLQEMGLSPLAVREDLSPMLVVISDEEDDDFAHINTLFQDLVD